MPMPPLFLYLILFSLCLLLLYWLLVTTEGVFLGRRIVVWLYDATAHRYDAIKGFDDEDEWHLVAKPILMMLSHQAAPLLLDVASGTGRVPYNLLRHPAFQGTVIGLEPSPRMLARARQKVAAQRGRCCFVQQVAVPLPFAEATFDAVTCLEALEFMPSAEAALREMVRVLRPGGVLITTRRKGLAGKAFLGRYRSQSRFEAFLRQLDLTQVHTLPWQVEYDLVTGVKSRLPQAGEVALSLPASKSDWKPSRKRGVSGKMRRQSHA